MSRLPSDVSVLDFPTGGRALWQREQPSQAAAPDDPEFPLVIVLFVLIIDADKCELTVSVNYWFVAL